MDFFYNLLPFLVVIMLGVMLGQLFSKRAVSRTAQKDRIIVVPYEEFRKHMRKGQLIDIRKQRDFEADRIKGARNFSPRFLRSKKQTLVRRDQDLYLYCHRGMRAKRLAKKLLSRFHRRIIVLEGGFQSTKKGNDR